MGKRVRFSSPLEYTFRVGFCFFRESRTLATRALGRAIFIILVICFFLHDAAATLVLEASGADRTSEPGTLKMQLQSSSRPPVNRGLTRGRAIRPQIRRVWQPASLATSNGVSSPSCRRGLKNKPRRRPNKPPGHSRRPLLILKVCRWGGAERGVAMRTFEREVIIQSALGEAN